MSPGFLKDFGRLLPPLRLRAPHEESAELSKEFGPLDPELRLREVPGKSLQGRGQHRRRRRWRPGLRGQPLRRVVVRIAGAPLRLLASLPLRLAVRRRARSLALSDARIGAEPVATEATGARSGSHAPTFPQRSHPPPSASVRRARVILGGVTRVIPGERQRVSWIIAHLAGRR